jgi:hypothetical protein
MYNECRHIFTSGRKCQSPSLKDQDFCYFHQSTRRAPQVPPRNAKSNPGSQDQPATAIHQLPPLEDADAIQLALSDVVLALAANRIDPRRAQILIYGLQVASQNNRHRAAMAAKEPAPAQTVRETHEHEDGTLVGPPRQRPDPEEIPVQERPSLGAILLRQAEAMHAEQEAERQTQQKTAEANPVSTVLPQIQATAHTPAGNPSFCRHTGWKTPASHKCHPFAERVGNHKCLPSPSTTSNYDQQKACPEPVERAGQHATCRGRHCHITVRRGFLRE